MDVYQAGIIAVGMLTNRLPGQDGEASCNWVLRHLQVCHMRLQLGPTVLCRQRGKRARICTAANAAPPPAPQQDFSQEHPRLVTMLKV